MNKVIDLLKLHRSIRKYQAKTISRKMLDEIVLAGQRAATANNVQATTVIRVSDEVKRKQIYEIAGKQSQILEAPEFLVICADIRRSQKCCEMHGKKAHTGYSEHLIIATVDASLFSQNMVVAAESLGLGICYIGAIRNNPQVVVDSLNLPEYVYPVFGLCLGYPEGESQVKPRLPLNIILKENIYDDSGDTINIQKYDALVRDYYASRDSNNKVSGWSEQMSVFLSKESRPHIKTFLKGRGFLAK